MGIESETDSRVSRTFPMVIECVVSVSQVLERFKEPLMAELGIESEAEWERQVGWAMEGWEDVKSVLPVSTQVHCFFLF